MYYNISTTKILSYKTLFFIVLIIAVLEGIWIYYSSNLNNSILLPSYSFSDLEKTDKKYKNFDLISAGGSWLSTTKLAYPLSTMKMDCWKSFNYCWIADAAIMDNNYLSVGLNLQEIAIWNDDYIETKPSSPLMGCVEETYRLDRRSQVVTYTRKTLDTTGLCEGVSKEPIVTKLGDGLERIKLSKQLH